MIARTTTAALVLSLLACGNEAPATPPAPSTATPPPTTAAPTTTAAPATTTAPAPEPESPLPPEPGAPIACDALDVPVYAGTLSEGVLRVTALTRGEAPDSSPRPPFSVRTEHVDLDGDGSEDVVGSWIDADGEPDCGNWGECVQGAFVRCDTGWAMVAPLGYVLDLRVGGTRTEHGGRRFRVLLVDTREDETDDEDAPAGPSTTVLAMDTRGYAGSTRDPWFESERCAAFVQAGQLLRARDMCQQGLDAHLHGSVRGALYFDLGRVAEAEGRTADAREAYVHSLEARPGNAIVEAHLAALPE